jgi:anaerobic selenocysteine-containing dehydrogenase
VHCPIVVEVEGGRPVRVTGDRANEHYAGFTCTKGRDQAAGYRPETRLLRSLKRRPDGSFVPISTELAISEIAERLEVLIDRYGPRSVANYVGGYAFLSHPANNLFIGAFMDAIGSPMRFNTNTIDQPGKTLAVGFHGAWMAPPQKFDDIDVLVLIGSNPLVSFQGLPLGNQRAYLKDFLGRGGQLIVIDPRRTDIAKRAHVHMQPRPGEDVAIVAGLIRVVLSEGLVDAEFVAEHVTGVDGLRVAVDQFTPEYVASRAGIEAEDLIAAARSFGTARRASVGAGTGPNMSGHGTLLEYLILCLDTICGHWLREGEVVKDPLIWVRHAAKAQAKPPFPTFGLGEKLRVRGLTDTQAGFPTGAANDEILLEGEGQVRALLSHGGNPVLAWPDQLKTIQAMESLDLLVQVDVQMSETARMADYVIATKRSLEMPGFTLITDMLTSYPTYGFTAPHAQYTPVVVDPPEGSELIEDWELYYELAKRMGLPLELKLFIPVYFDPDPLSPRPPVVVAAVDMDQKPTNDELFATMTAGARVPFDEIKRHPHGAIFAEPPVIVEARDPGWTGRLDVGSTEMVRELARYVDEVSGPEEPFPFRMISRRNAHTFNSASDDPPRPRRFNPAYMNPADLVRLGLTTGDVVEIRSARAAITAVVEEEPGVREGAISMSHGFGDAAAGDGEMRQVGSPTGRLIGDEPFERYSGQPRMSNIPVRVRALDST